MTFIQFIELANLILITFIFITFVELVFDYYISQFHTSSINDKIDELEEKINELEDENQYLISMDNMRQEEWEKLMRAQSKIYTQIKGEFEKKFKKINKLLKKD